MEIKKCALVALILLFSMSPVCAQSLWVSSEEGFAARFPSDPEKVEATSSTKSGYAYQSSKKFKAGFALYAVTIVGSIPKISKTADVKKYIEKANIGYIKSNGQNPAGAQIKWTQFGDGRPKLKYATDIQYRGIQLRSKGYWITDEKRILRISVTYTKNIANKYRRNIGDFLDTFVLIDE